MEDYEDDAPWTGVFNCYYPTYHDMTTKQLRGYFAWRTQVRKGVYDPIPVSAAYLYLYELLGGVGTESVEDALQKLKAFEKGFLDGGFGDQRMRQKLHRWMLDLAVIRNAPVSQALACADPETLRKDPDLARMEEYIRTHVKKR